MLRAPTRVSANAANPFYCSFVKPLYAKPLSLCITAKCGAEGVDVTVPASGVVTDLKTALAKSMEVPATAIRVIQKGKILPEEANVLTLGPTFRVMITLGADYKDRVKIRVLLPSAKLGFKGIPLNVCVGDTIAKLKKRLQEAHGFPSGEELHLLLNGTSLEDQMSLHAAKVKAGDTLYVLPRVNSTLKLWLQPSDKQPERHTNQISLRVCKAFSISWRAFELLQPQKEYCEAIVREALIATEQAVIQREAWASPLIRMLEQPVSNVMATGAQLVMVSVPPERLCSLFFPPAQSPVAVAAVETTATSVKIAAASASPPCGRPITQHYAAQDKENKPANKLGANKAAPLGEQPKKVKKKKSKKSSSYKSLMKGLLTGVGTEESRSAEPEAKKAEERRAGLGGGAFQKLDRI